MTGTFKKLTYAIAAALVAVLCFLITSDGGGARYASAASAYSSALDDLKKDGAFSPSTYPSKASDHSLQVIQIAETTDNELLVYVYQPSAETIKLTATELRFSTSIGDNLQPIDYTLKLLNRDGVFAKYLVNDFTVKSDVVRYYDIIQISRKWNKDIDSTNDANDIGTVSFTIAKRFTACTLDGNVSYTCIDNEVIEIKPESKFIGYFRYFEGLGFIITFSEADCWYVGFDTDKPIDNLYEAEISFQKRTVERNYMLGVQSSERFGEWQQLKNYTITGEDKGSAGNGFLAHRYEWKRIVSIDEFTSSPDYNLSNSEKENLRGCKWVLRFYETERKTIGDYKVKQVTSWQIADVTILRLKFETDGITYNLGVVDNKQSPKPDQRPGNWADSKTLWEMYIDFCKFLESLTGVSYIFWAIFFIVLAGSAIIGILSIFFPIIRKGVVVVANFFWRVISSPFRALIKLIDRLEERRAQREESNAEASIEPTKKKLTKEPKRNAKAKKRGKTKKD